MGFIYMLTSPTKKSYIGQTICTIEERFRKHQMPGSNCIAIYNAIQKHGWDNFEKHWYEVPDEDLNDHEDLMVEVLGTLAPGGYNLKKGGGSGGSPCEEVKQKISKTMTGRTLSDEHKQNLSESHKGKTHTEEAKLKMSELHKGKVLSVEQKKKMSKSHKGKTNPDSKKVYQYTINGTFLKSFSSCGTAASHLNKKHQSSIYECANGNRKTAYGFKWSFTELYISTYLT
ncbi:GIY-YIG catalytic domain-containing endonuclease [Acanthocystis turfacea Chlorella virus NE-JV-2]|nr:GIY-YIG catalytic domain-containing endonuclease [Acanthocystis turfacea Chlorella virus NE-JV-2]